MVSACESETAVNRIYDFIINRHKCYGTEVPFRHMNCVSSMQQIVPPAIESIVLPRHR